MDDTITQLPEADDPPALRGPRRFPWLWLGLALGLAVCFALDNAVMWALRPLLGTPFNHFIEHTIRWLGNGKLHIPVLLLLVLAGVVPHKPTLRAVCLGMLAVLTGLVLLWVAGHYRSVLHGGGPRLVVAFTFVKLVGLGLFLVPPALILARLVGPRVPVLRAGAWGLLAFAVSGLACNIIKVLTHRARPWVTDPPPAHWLGYIRAHGYQSFPSGDVSTTFAIALMIAYFIPKLRVPLLIIGVLVALERMVLGVHHLSDVWAGAMLGLLVAQLLVGRLERRTRVGAGTNQ